MRKLDNTMFQVLLQVLKMEKENIWSSIFVRGLMLTCPCRCALGSSVRLCYASAALLYKYYDQIVWGPSHAPQEGLEVAEYTQ